MCETNDALQDTLEMSGESLPDFWAERGEKHRYLQASSPNDSGHHETLPVITASINIIYCSMHFFRENDNKDLLSVEF